MVHYVINSGWAQNNLGFSCHYLRPPSINCHMSGMGFFVSKIMGKPSNPMVFVQPHFPMFFIKNAIFGHPTYNKGELISLLPSSHRHQELEGYTHMLIYCATSFAVCGPSLQPFTTG